MIKRMLLILLFIIPLASAGHSMDLRALKIERFLLAYPNSPLRDHIDEILYCADRFGLDYRLYLAIAGAESTFGKKYPKDNHNLTGILNGSKQFDSIYENIFETHKLIATGKWYKKYRKTNDVKDLIYTYKGVPPYNHYIGNVRFALDKINAVSVDDEKALLAGKSSPGLKKVLSKQKQKEQLSVWNSIRYDLYEPHNIFEIDIKKITTEKRWGEINEPIGLPDS